MRNAFLIPCLFCVAASVATSASKHARLRSVEVNRPNIFIRGAYLAKVEVWAVPTGTGITPAEYALVGKATRQAAAGQNEIWLFPIDCTSPLIPSTEVFVKAFDRTGKTVGRESLPYTGASELHDALCANH